MKLCDLMKEMFNPQKKILLRHMLAFYQHQKYSFGFSRGLDLF